MREYLVGIMAQPTGQQVRAQSPDAHLGVVEPIAQVGPTALQSSSPRRFPVGFDRRALFSRAAIFEVRKGRHEHGHSNLYQATARVTAR